MNGKIIPPIPNLAGDDVRFVRKDADGSPINWGHMHKENILRMQASGDNIEIVGEDWRPPVVQQDLTPHVKFTIAQTLDLTDKYFTSDSMDNIDQSMQAKWRLYRKALRDAAKFGTLQGMLANIPSADPKGNDPFQRFR